MSEALVKQGYEVQGDFQHMAEKPSSSEAMQLAQHLMDMYVAGNVDKVEILYNHFKNTASQILTHEVYLPITLLVGQTEQDARDEVDYISVESQISRSLLQKVHPMKLNRLQQIQFKQC